MIRKPPSTSLWDMIPIGLSHQNSEAFMGNRFQFKGDFYKNVFTLAILLAIHMKKRIGLQRTLVEKGANVSIY